MLCKCDLEQLSIVTAPKDLVATCFSTKHQPEGGLNKQHPHYICGGAHTNAVFAQGQPW